MSDMLYHSYYARNFGQSHENDQIEIGRNSKGKIRSFVRLTYNYQHGMTTDTSKEGLQSFLNDQERDNDWFRTSSEREFITLALAAESVNRPYFED